MKKTFKNKKFMVAGAVAITAAAIAGGAFAYFTAIGSGQASGQVATASDLTIIPGTATADLYPGAAGDVALTISNANPTRIHVNSLELSSYHGGFDASAGCTDPKLSFTPQDNGGNGWDVDASDGTNDGTLELTLDDAVHMGDDASNDCQGATFTVYLTTGP